jgi:haloalkane dehalogenase
MKHHWLDRSEYPFSSHFFEVNGHRLHYIDEGFGNVILFVHGTPSWSFDYRNIIKLLRSEYRCIALDHMGFGLSDKPEYYDYSTQNHSKTLERFILDKKLEDITLVVHDFGGVIGLNVAMAYPEKITRLVIINSWLWSSKQDPDFIRFSKVLRSPVLPWLYRYLNFSARFILPRSFGERRLSRRLLRQYTGPFGRASERNGPLAFARSLLNDQDWFEELWSRCEVIARKPTLFVWGMRDPVIKPHNLDTFLAVFKNATTIRLGTSGHFPQEEEPEAVTKSILDFLKKYRSPA